MSIETLLDILKQTPLVALCIILVWALKILYTDSKKERKYSRSEEIKNMETLTRVLEVIKENAVEKRTLSEKLTYFTEALNRLIDKK